MMDITHPKIQAIKHDNKDGRQCLIIEVENEGDKIGLHFENKDEVRAFIGILMMSVGMKNANPK